MNSKEIAKLAGVSRSTISKVVNNYAYISDETKRKVLEVVNKYGYVPHASARNLAGKSNKIIGVFITGINNSRDFRVIESDYFSPFTIATVDYTDKYDYKILVLVIGKYIIINSKNLEGAYKATKHLIEYGHREIAHICGDMNKYSGFKRLEGYKKALNEEGLPIKEEYIVEGDFTEDSGYEAAKKLFSKKNKITGIFASNDTMAIGAMRFIKEIGYKIPDDISLVGYDDIKIARYISPSLTTIRVSILDMASIAVKSLINFIEKDIKSSKYNTSKYNTVSTELIIRQSSKRIKE